MLLRNVGMTSKLIILTFESLVVISCSASFNVLPTQLYLCVLCGNENKQRLFPYTALTDWFYSRDGVFTKRYGLGIYI